MKSVPTNLPFPLLYGSVDLTLTSELISNLISYKPIFSARARSRDVIFPLKVKGKSTFSSALKPPKSRKSWNKKPQFSPRQSSRADSLCAFKHRSPQVTLPRCGVTIPLMIFKKVDFPLPEAPRRPKTSPAWMERSSMDRIVRVLTPSFT